MNDGLKKKLCAAAIAAGAATVVGAGGCALFSSQGNVYGPPPWEEGEDPELVEEVYGPPEWFDSNYEGDVEDADGDGSDADVPEGINESDDAAVQLVYGPPTWDDEPEPEPLPELDDEE